MRLPVHAHEMLVKLRWVELDMWQELNRAPTEEELAERVGLTLPRLRDIRMAGQELRSLDAPSGPGVDANLTALLPDLGADDPERLATSTDLRAALLAALARLEARERTVLELRYGIVDGKVHTLEEIGTVFGVTRERIRQIELRGLRKLAQRQLGHLRAELSA